MIAIKGNHMSIKMLVVWFLAIGFFLANSGCSEAIPDTSANRTVLRLPYLSGCESAVENTREVFEKISKKNGVLLGIEIVPYDVTPISHKELAGFIILFAEGDWRTLSSKTPLEYLRVRADSIVSDCMPNNGFKVAWSELGALETIISSTTRKGKAYPKISENGLQLYFNDASYSVPTL